MFKIPIIINCVRVFYALYFVLVRFREEDIYFNRREHGENRTKGREPHNVSADKQLSAVYCGRKNIRKMGVKYKSNILPAK